MPSFTTYAVSALAAAGLAYGQCSDSATKTIQNAGDATGLASCSTFSGSIAIATGTTDDIAIGGVKKITGNLVADSNSNIRRIAASDLEELGGMKLNELTRLAGVDFPKLKKVDSITWNALPNLQSIGFTASVEQAKIIDIQNTAIRSLEGINIQQAEKLTIANNAYINEIKMQLGNVSDSLDFSENNKAVMVELPNLIWANKLTFRSCGNVSMPSLEKTNGSIGLYDNAFESFALPNLTEVGVALTLAGNEQLTNASFPKLTKVNDDIRFANNTKLTVIDGLPLLESVDGAFDMSGNLTEVTTPKLDNVKGAFNIQSSDNITDSCPFYQDLKDKKLIQGKIFCKGKLENPSTEGTKPTSQSGDEEGAAATLSAMNGALGLAAMAAVFLL